VVEHPFSPWAGVQFAAMTQYATHQAAESMVKARLESRGYKVSASRIPGAHFHVEHPDGCDFDVRVQGNRNQGSWWATERGREGLYFILVVVRNSRFFILNSKEWDAEVREYRRTHNTPYTAEGFNWGQGVPYEDKWHKLPCWK